MFSTSQFLFKWMLSLPLASNFRRAHLIRRWGSCTCRCHRSKVSFKLQSSCFGDYAMLSLNRDVCRRECWLLGQSTTGFEIFTDATCAVINVITFHFRGEFYGLWNAPELLWVMVDHSVHAVYPDVKSLWQTSWTSTIIMALNTKLCQRSLGFYVKLTVVTK